jgi:hypothetical protein
VLWYRGKDINKPRVLDKTRGFGFINKSIEHNIKKIRAIFLMLCSKHLETSAHHVGQCTHARKAQPVQFFPICKGALNRTFSPLVQPIPVGGLEYA